jgi:hypothetical protein
LGGWSRFLVGVAIGVVALVVAVTIACPQGFGFILAGGLLVGGLLVEGAGFLVGRLVRWAITGP